MTKPGDAIAIDFTTHNPETGGLQDADSLPTGAVVRNGADDVSVTVTVANKSTGRYKATLTIPSGYAAGDEVQLYIAATVKSVSGGGVVWGDTLDTKRVSDLSVPTATENALALLKLDWTTVSGAAARSVLNALRFLRNRWFTSGSTLTVTEEDDTTAAWSAALTVSSGANPVTGSDPE